MIILRAGDRLIIYLPDEVFDSGELVHGDGHLTHVVGHLRRTAQRMGSYGFGERLIQSLQPLRQCLFRLLC